MGDDGGRAAAGRGRAHDRGTGEARAAFPWLWLLPGLALLVALTVWGVVVYPHLPDRVPQHFGSEGVSRFAAKSVGSVFLPVFAQAGVLLVMATVSYGVLSMRPESEMVPGEPRSALVNRPATREGAVRSAKATLFLGFCIGLTLVAACAVMWQTGPWQDPPGWYPVLVTAPSLLGAVPVVVVALRDKWRASHAPRPSSSAP
ncbi:DUF1648 domain-containing protein [Streptomyces daliensis]